MVQNNIHRMHVLSSSKKWLDKPDGRARSSTDIKHHKTQSFYKTETCVTCVNPAFGEHWSFRKKQASWANCGAAEIITNSHPNCCKFVKIWSLICSAGGLFLALRINIHRLAHPSCQCQGSCSVLGSSNLIQLVPYSPLRYASMPVLRPALQPWEGTLHGGRCSPHDKNARKNARKRRQSISYHCLIDLLCHNCCESGILDWVADCNEWHCQIRGPTQGLALDQPLQDLKTEKCNRYFEDTPVTAQECPMMSHKSLNLW